MLELSNERIEQILNEETTKTVELATLLRSIYTRYMRLFEGYFADIDALDDAKIAQWRKYHEETCSLVKYYYMDIPHDVCEDIEEFNDKFSAKLLGPKWYDNLAQIYDAFQDENWEMSDKRLKAEFKKQALASFYKEMDNIFREGFGTGSKTVGDVVSGIAGLLFGKEQKEK